MFLESRKLSSDENPLFVQLGWIKDDREGRFLLKNDDDLSAVSILLCSNVVMC